MAQVQSDMLHVRKGCDLEFLKIEKEFGEIWQDSDAGLLAAGKIFQARAKFLLARVGGLLAAGQIFQARAEILLVRAGG